ncbi:MAG TPA: HD domain-containing phosphohydrolase [Candidatus Baltobacteraceae bacterium]|nr:HD domain-containing phosphohydrolase [Candidatus Baltobacteraceae bacterium]
MNVLMIDDNELNLTVYRNALKAVEGAVCIGFTSSAEGLKWCEEHQADVVLVDYDMPRPNGLEFIEAFHLDGSNADVPIIMITGLAERDIRYRALELGAADFLTKPVDVAEFRARMRNMLALADGRRKLADRANWLASEVQRATADIVAREKDTINRLMRAAEFRDNETGMHILRMGHFSAVIGRAFGLSENECETLLMATPMHDIGKVATPDRILLKPGKLDSGEWEIMKQHTIAGYEILKDSQSELLQMAAQIALNHHEKFNGTGYPYGLEGERIPLCGRICAVSDVFDALTSERPYKQAWPIEEAVDEIRRLSGSHFDPALVEAFDNALPTIVDIKTRYGDEDWTARAGAVTRAT